VSAGPDSAASPGGRDAALVRLERLEGAVLGAVGAPAAAWGAVWSGIGDTGPASWAFTLLVGALIGAATWPIFAASAGTPGRRGVGFSALFGGCAGLLGGTFGTFPMGAVMGSLGGAIGGAVVALAGRLRPRLAGWSLALGGVAGGGLGLLVIWIWTS